MTRIALIHATPVAMQPIADAFARGWPQARTFNLLDDALSPDLVRAGRLDATFFARFEALAAYVRQARADAILFTCSAFGPAIEAVAAASPVPVLKPNEAMFEAALAAGRRIGMLATLRESIAPMEAEFHELARAPDATIESVWTEGAMDALLAGRGEEHDRLLARAAARLAHCDAVMLAHFSTARGHAAVSAVLEKPVLTSPDSAVARLKSILAAPASAAAS